MRKRILTSLFFLTILFSFVSCSNLLRTKSNVTMNFDVQQYYKAISAREATSSNDTKRLLEVKLFVDNEEFEKKSQYISSDDTFVSFDFKGIPLNSTVYVKAWIKIIKTEQGTDIEIEEAYGESYKKVVTRVSTGITLKLKISNKSKGETITNNYPVSVNYQMWVQKKEVQNPQTVDDYELEKTFTCSTDYNSISSTSQKMLDNDFSMQITEYQFCKEIQGYTINEILSDREPDISEGVTNITCAVYFDKTGQEIIPLKMNGIDSNNKAYELNIYNSESGSSYYIINDSQDDKVAFGIFSASEVSGMYMFMYAQMFYYDNFIARSSLNVSDPTNPYGYQLVQYTTSNPPANFIIDSIVDGIGTTVSITFTYPFGFNVYSLVPYNGDDLPVIGQIIIAGTPKVSINKVDATEPLCLNKGEQQFNITKLDTSVQITQLSAKLYYEGKEVQSNTYLVQSNSQNLVTISPKFLSNGGTYIAKVIVKGSYEGKEFEACSNYILQVENQVIATLDVSQDTFMQTLIEVMSKASGPVKLTLTGVRNFNTVDSYSPECSLYQNIGYVFQQFNKNPVELDMSGVSGNSVSVLETQLLSSVCTSVKLAPNLKAIHYVHNTPVDISQSDSSISSGPWYSIVVDKSWEDSKSEIVLIKQVLAGSKTINEVYSLLEPSNIYSNFEISTTDWSEVMNTLSGYASTNGAFTYYFIKGEN